MNKRILLLSLLLIFFSLQSKATVVYVDVTHTGGTQDGTNWASAFPNFQSGINAANAGDSVWVAKGIYEADSFFVMKEGVKIFGGFVNTDIIFEQRNWKTREAILTSGYRVIVNSENGLTAAALLNGFVISWGKGGIFNLNSSPSISNCTIRVNSAVLGEDRGGGILNINANPIISNCFFQRNIGYKGGAISNDHSSPNIVNCVFSGNQGNSSYGKDIANTNASLPKITNCTFFKSKGSSLGVIFNSQGSLVEFSNSIIWGNDTGIVNFDSSNTIIKYCLIQGMAANEANHNMDGNIDPLLSDTSSTYHHLLNNSPCIGKGSNAAYISIGGNLQNDLGMDDNPRLVENIIDIGASENPNQSTGVKGIENRQQNIYSIYPNPTKETIHINFTDEKLLHTNVILTDTYGRIVRSAMIESKSQQLSLAGLAQGIYILKTENGAAVKIVKE